jgi:hypothetical protein
MSTVKTTYIQHPSSETPSITLNADGTVAITGGVSEGDVIALVIALGG